MSLAFVIELHSEVIGLVVRDGNHYRFHSAVQKFGSLNGRPFQTPQDAEKAIRRREAAVKSSTAVAPRSNDRKPGALATPNIPVNE